MTDPTFTPEEDRQLLVVYPTQRQALAAKEALLEAGVPEPEIHIGRDADTATALRAEMHEEVSNAWVVPNAGVAYTKESAQGLAIWCVAGTVVGLLLAAPLALIDFGSSYGVRYLIWALVLVAMGLTVALVAGPASSSERPAEPSAAVAGVVVRVNRDTPELRTILAELEPTRLDEVSRDDQPIANLVNDGEDTVRERAKDIRANAGSDDFQSPR